MPHRSALLPLHAAVPASSADFRGLTTVLFEVAKELYEVARDAIRERRTYRSAQDYDVALIYDDDTGKVTRVDFVRRAPEATRTSK